MPEYADDEQFVNNSTVNTVPHKRLITLPCTQDWMAVCSRENLELLIICKTDSDMDKFISILSNDSNNITVK